MPPPLLLLAPLLVLAGPSGGPPRVQAVRATGPIVLDGKLDDPAWRAAPPSDAFTQHQPDEGAPPSERTEFRVVYDDDALYVGVDCHQVNSPVVRRLMRRDGQLPSDGVWMDIDSRRDGASAFHFAVNAAGVLSDAIHFNDVDYSQAWDENWEAKVADTGHGYSVEFRIPLRVLRFDAAPITDWGFQMRRFIDARQEYDDWAFYPRTGASYVAYFGRLENLVGLRPGRRLQLLPFVMGRVRARGAKASSTTLASGTDTDFTGGLNAKLQVTQELTLDMAVLPDFGQVEADSVVLNLSNYETFFPEKRPFFLEGGDVWSSNATLVYTRRIGRQAAAPTLLAGETLYDAPEPSAIYGAAKLVGTVKGRTTVGLLSAVTGRRDALIQRSDGQRELRLVDPLTTYNVVRAKQLVGGRSEVGLFGTAVSRLPPPLATGALCPTTAVAVTSSGRCFNDAYVASADGRWRSATGDYAASGQVTGSLLAGGPLRPQRDGLAIEPGHPSAGAIAWVAKQGGANWLWSVWQGLSGKRLELNDLGYLDRKNDYTLVAELTHRNINPWGLTLERRKTVRLRYRETLDGIPLSRGVELVGSWTFSNYWGLSTDAHYFGAIFDDRETGDGTALERAAQLGATLSVSSDPRRRVVFSSYSRFDHITSGYRFEGSGQITFRVLPQLELDVLPTVVLSGGEPRFVFQETVNPTLGTPSYVFGRQRARSAGATLRASYTFTPELSLQTYAQLFLAAVHYSDFSRAAPPGFRGRIHRDDLTPTTTTTNPDLQTATLNINVVLRWEFRLGSTLFLVYTRAQSPPVSLTTGSDPRLDPQPLLRSGSSVDVVLLKLAYWWG